MKGVSYENVYLDGWSMANKESLQGTFCFAGGIAGCVGLSNVSDCENKAKISGQYGGLGGIIGGCMVMGAKTFTNCNNFGMVSYEGSVNDVNNIIEGIGGIIGVSKGECIIEASKNHGEINGGAKWCGGICGAGIGIKIHSCENYGNIIGAARTGGIVGRILGHTANQIPEVFDCSNSGKISGIKVGPSFLTIYNCSDKSTREMTGWGKYCFVGGIVGAGTVGSVKRCTNSGNINSAGAGCGGIWGGGTAGRTTREIVNCNNIGEVNGTYCVGGIIGFLQVCSVTTSVNEGKISGSENNVGGICGYGGGINFVRCDNKGEIRGNDNIGGILGHGGGDENFNKCSINTCKNYGSYTATISGGKVGALVGINNGVTIS